MWLVNKVTGVKLQRSISVKVRVASVLITLKDQRSFEKEFKDSWYEDLDFVARSARRNSIEDQLSEYVKSTSFKIDDFTVYYGRVYETKVKIIAEEEHEMTEKYNEE